MDGIFPIYYFIFSPETEGAESFFFFLTRGFGDFKLKLGAERFFSKSKFGDFARGQRYLSRRRTEYNLYLGE